MLFVEENNMDFLITLHINMRRAMNYEHSKVDCFKLLYAKSSGAIYMFYTMLDLYQPLAVAKTKQ